ncbi:MAG: diacylglycerol/lipid kinase family protein, partial [Geminicoccaceae bacterium]
YETAKQIISSDSSSYRFDIGNGEQEAQGVIIANGKHYAGRYVAAPKADLEKPSLEICRMTRSGWVATSGYLMSLALGRLAERGDYHVSAATAIDIQGPPGAPLQADGDILCHLPATINVLPAAIDLIFPRATPDPDSSHFQEKPAS